MSGEERRRGAPRYGAGTEVYLAEDGTGPVTVTAWRVGAGGAPQYRTTHNPKGAWLDEGDLVLRPATSTTATRTAGEGSSSSSSSSSGNLTVLQQRPDARDPEDWAADFAVVLPDALQTVLVRDAHAREAGTAPPGLGTSSAGARGPTVRDALDAYARHMERTCAGAGAVLPGGVAADHYRDVLATLRVLLDCYLCPCLLYAGEHAAHRRAFPPASRRRPSSVYGCVYLLRLCAALPAVAAVADAALCPAARPVFVAHVQHLLAWLADNQARYFPQQQQS